MSARQDAGSGPTRPQGERAAGARLLLLAAGLFAPACDGCGTRPSLEPVDPVARCLTTDGDVRRRLYSSSAWRSLSGGADLFAGDWVQTAQRATAELEYAGGAMLRVEPGSTVVIQPPDSDPEAAVRRIVVRSGRVEGRIPGSREGRASRRVAVDLADGRSVQLTPGDDSEVRYRVDVDPAGRADVSVVRGEAEVTASDGVARTAVEGTAVRLDPAGRARTQALPPAPAAPQPDRSDVRSGQSVLLEWAGASGLGYRVEVASDPGFRQRIAEIRTRTSRLEYRPNQPGPLYVRVSSIDANGLQSVASEAIELRVRPDDRLRLLRKPADGTTFETRERTAVVGFSWVEPPGGGPYRLEVSAADGETEQTMMERASERPEARGRFRPGRYRWGVYGPGGEPLFAEPFTFRVERTRIDLEVPSRLRWPNPRRSRD